MPGRAEIKMKKRTFLMMFVMTVSLLMSYQAFAVAQTETAAESDEKEAAEEDIFSSSRLEDMDESAENWESWDEEDVTVENSSEENVD